MSNFDPAKAKELAQMLRDKVGSKEYYSPKETLDDLRYSIGAGETATNTAKLVGKSLFNIGKFVGGSVLPSIIDHTANNYNEGQTRSNWATPTYEDDGLDDDIREMNEMQAEIDAEMAYYDQLIDSMSYEDDEDD